MRRSFLAGILGVGALASLALAAPAAFWTSTGPAGGVVRCLAASPTNPQVVYAGVFDGGVFRSDDGGDVWLAVTAGLGDFDVRGLAVSPADPLRVLAGTGGGVFHSGDGGATWAASASLAGAAIDAILFDPVSAGTAYAAGISSGTLAKSTDGGVTWSSIGGSVAALGLPASLVFDVEFAGVAYAGAAQGVWKSIDGGRTWSAAASGLPAAVILALLPVPGSGGAVVAATSQGV